MSERTDVRAVFEFRPARRGFPVATEETTSGRARKRGGGSPKPPGERTRYQFFRDEGKRRRKPETGDNRKTARVRARRKAAPGETSTRVLSEPIRRKRKTPAPPSIAKLPGRGRENGREKVRKQNEGKTPFRLLSLYLKGAEKSSGPVRAFGDFHLTEQTVDAPGKKTSGVSTGGGPFQANEANYGAIVQTNVVVRTNDAALRKRVRKLEREVAKLNRRIGIAESAGKDRQTRKPNPTARTPR